MQMVAATVNQGSENPLRAHNPELQMRQRREPEAETTGEQRAAYLALEAQQSAPAAYTMLLSRIDNQLREGGADAALVERLRSLLSTRIRSLTAHTREAVQALPQVAELGVNELGTLPEVVQERLREGEGTDTVLDLLRTPRFAAAMRDEPRTRFYGPGGMLRAS